MIPSSPSQPPAEREIVRRVRIARLLRASPTPSPKPPRRVTPPLVLTAPIPAHSALLAAPHRGKTVRPDRSRPIWDATPGRTGALTSLAGNGAAAAGSGTAAATSGDGAAANGDEPCGFVEFSDPHGSQYDPRTQGFHVDIRMSVHFADGGTQSMILDYAWYYASEAANPWSDRNLKDPNFPTRFQPPPPDKAAGEPPLVRYVMAHSTADGMTLLKDCPSPPARG